MTTAELSHWGWGYRERFPDATERLGASREIGRRFGGGDFPPAEPVPLEAARLPEPAFPVPDELAGFTSQQRFDRASHTYGRTFRDVALGFAGDFSVAPDLVCAPRSESEILAAMEWCRANEVALIPYGGGTSVARGVEGDVGLGYGGVVSLDLRRLDAVVDVDTVSRAARIEAGATGPALERQLAEHGLTLRHFPQSFELSTLGGWLATRAGGHFATTYTHIDDLTESIRMLTFDGTWESLRVPASGAGPSPDRLLLGSEGTLGVITEAWMRVRPRPRWRSKATVLFTEWDAAVDAVREIAQAELHPANCRLLDATEAMINRVSTGPYHVLLLGFESAGHDVSPWMSRALAVAERLGGSCPDGARQSEGERSAVPGGPDEAWRRAFLDAPYLLNTMVSIGLVVDTFETACTWDAFAALDANVVSAVMGAVTEHCGTGIVTRRFTHVYPDGPAPYYTFLAPGQRGDLVDQWTAIKAAAADAVAGSGGTITHHHAVGRLHRPWYDRQRPEPFAAAIRAAKQELDPDWVLNPGVLIDR